MQLRGLQGAAPGLVSPTSRARSLLTAKGTRGGRRSGPPSALAAEPAPIPQAALCIPTAQGCRIPALRGTGQASLTPRASSPHVHPGSPQSRR